MSWIGKSVKVFCVFWIFLYHGQIFLLTFFVLLSWNNEKNCYWNRCPGPFNELITQTKPHPNRWPPNKLLVFMNSMNGPSVIWSFCFCFSHHFGNRLHIPLSSYICTLGLDCMIAVCWADIIFHFLHVEMSKIIGEVCVSKFRWNMNGGSETNLGNSRKPQKVWVWRKIGQMLVFLL